MAGLFLFQMCVPYQVAAFLVIARTVLLRTNMDAKFVNVQVSVEDKFFEVPGIHKNRGSAEKGGYKMNF